MQHEKEVFVPSWSGTGYMVIDNTNGDGAFLIGGGGNGGFVKFLDDNGTLINGILLFANILMPQKYAFKFALIATVLSLLTIWAMYTILATSTCNGGDAEYAAVVLTAISMGGMIVSAIAGGGKGPATFIGTVMLIYGAFLENAAKAALKLKCGK